MFGTERGRAHPLKVLSTAPPLVAVALESLGICEVPAGKLHDEELYSRLAVNSLSRQVGVSC